MLAFHRSPSKLKITVCPSGVKHGLDKKKASLCAGEKNQSNCITARKIIFLITVTFKIEITIECVCMNTANKKRNRYFNAVSQRLSKIFYSDNYIDHFPFYKND